MRAAWFVAAAAVIVTASLAYAADTTNEATKPTKNDATVTAGTDATPQPAQPVLVAAVVSGGKVPGESIGRKEGAAPMGDPPNCPVHECSYCNAGTCRPQGSLVDTDTGLTSCLLPTGQGLGCVNGKTIHEIGHTCVSPDCGTSLCYGFGTSGWICE